MPAFPPCRPRRLALGSVLGLVLGLALGALPGAAAARAKPAPKPARSALALKPDPEVPPAGSAAELLDLGTGKGRAVAPLRESLADFQATAFPDGRVLVTGGSLTGPVTQWFEPATRSFSPGPAMTRIRQGHRALLLQDGRLLLVGGTEAPAPAECLDPKTGRFQALAGDAKFSLSADAVELEGGKVLLVDGLSGQMATWDGRKGVRGEGSLKFPRIFFRALRLQDGRVAITGGWPSAQKPRGRRPAAAGPNLPVECFNPRWSTLSTWKALPKVRARHQATLLADGRICLWAGYGQDATETCEAMELLDPVKETVTEAGRLALHGNPFPAWAPTAAGRGYHLADQGREVQALADPLALLQPGPATRVGRLANGYVSPTLVPLGNGSVLVLGSPAWGEPVDRWDPRTRQCAPVGSLRMGVQTLAPLPDGRVVVLGAIVDLLDPRTGSLKPLGYREDLGDLLKALKPYQAPPAASPPFAPGPTRAAFLTVPLDKTHALVVGGAPAGAEGPPGLLELWDLKKKTLSPVGTLKTRRSFDPKPGGPSQGALALADGAVLIWGPGPEKD